MGSLDPTHEKQIATRWQVVYICALCGMAAASRANESRDNGHAEGNPKEITDK